MKKLLLFIGLSVMTFGAFAGKVPSVVVNKFNGGWMALLNLYNYVTYTPAEVSPNGIGQLDCSGSGFTACRVPNCTSMNVNDGSMVSSITDVSKLNAFKTAINDVIVQYETALEQSQSCATHNGNSKAPSVPTVYSKQIVLANNSNATNVNRQEHYVVRGVVKAMSSQSSTMEIYIEKVNLFSLSGSN